MQIKKEINIVEDLILLGLSYNEAKIYYHLYSNPNNNTVKQLSLNLSIHRSNCYDIMKTLEHKKLIVKLGNGYVAKRFSIYYRELTEIFLRVERYLNGVKK